MREPAATHTAYGRGFREGIKAAARHVKDGFVLIPAAAQWADKRRLLADSVLALSSAPPSLSSGERLTPLDDAETTEAMLEERVRALEALLRECAESMEARPEDPGLQTMARAARRALSPQGDCNGTSDDVPPGTSAPKSP